MTSDKKTSPRTEPDRPLNDEREERTATAITMLCSVAQDLPPEELSRFAAKLNRYCEQHGVRIRVGFGDEGQFVMQ